MDVTRIVPIYGNGWLGSGSDPMDTPAPFNVVDLTESSAGILSKVVESSHPFNGMIALRSQRFVGSDAEYEPFNIEIFPLARRSSEMPIEGDVPLFTGYALLERKDRNSQ